MNLRLKDSIYNDLWAFFLLCTMIVLLSESSGNQIAKEVDPEQLFIPGFILLSFMTGIFIFLMFILSVIKKKTFKFLGRDQREAAKTKYDAMKYMAEDWIEINRFKINPNYSVSERKRFLSEMEIEQIEHKVRHFVKYLHFTPFRNTRIVNAYLTFSLLLLIVALIFGYINLIELLIILFLHQFLSSLVNRQVIFYTIYFCLSYIVLIIASKGVFGNAAKINAKISLMHSDDDEEDQKQEIHIKNENIELTTGVLKEGCPPIELLDAQVSSIDINQANDMRNKLIFVLEQFELSFLKIKSMEVGASITRFTFSMNSSGRVGTVTRIQNELSMQLGVESIRISTGSSGLILEVPNKKQTPIPYREVLELYRKTKSDILEVPIGKLAVGGILTIKINELPHLLIAGGTGSGKSVCINTIIVSLLYNCTPNQLKFIFIDPKVVELKVYEGIPHLLMPVINDPIQADSALKFAVSEMEERYKKFASCGVRNITAYNQKNSDKMQFVVIIIDELADLMAVAKSSKEITIENSICRLGQMARAAGIHLVIGTQRPSAEVITGLIKANIPGRIAFALPSQVDSRTVIDAAGAEKLLGKGDGLLLTTQTREPLRFQGAFLKDSEIEKVIEWWKLNNREILELPEILKEEKEEKEENVCIDEEIEIKEEKTEIEVKLLVMLAEYAYSMERQYDEKGIEKEIELPWSREKIREIIGCGKASLQEALNKLTAEEIIKSSGAGRGTKTYFTLSDQECYNVLKKYSPEAIEKFQ